MKKQKKKKKTYSTFCGDYTQGFFSNLLYMKSLLFINNIYVYLFI